MRNRLMALTVMVAILSCVGLVAAGQGQGTKPTAPKSTKEIAAMRKEADKIGKALSKAVQAYAVKTGKYNNVLSDYSVDFGGKLPINPCTGTRTGYTMTVSEDGKDAAVASSAGMNCGKWTPKVYRLKLKLKASTQAVSKEILAMRITADRNAREFAMAAQSHAIKAGKYTNVMTDYAVDFGGKIPINPCTGTRTGYTMTVSKDANSASVAASAGLNCGKWTPVVFNLTINRRPPQSGDHKHL